MIRTLTLLLTIASLSLLSQVLPADDALPPGAPEALSSGDWPW